MAVVTDSFLITYEAQPNGKIKMLQFLLLLPMPDCKPLSGFPTLWQCSHWDLRKRTYSFSAPTGGEVLAEREVEG